MAFEFFKDKLLLKLVLIGIVINLVIIFFIPILTKIFIYNSRVRNTDILQLWNVWDAPHYLSIAQFGYQTKRDPANFIVFLPLYPLLTAFFKIILLTDYLPAAYLVSFVFSIALSVLFYKLVQLDFSKKIAFNSVILMLLFPTAFFLYIPYTESLFIFLCVTTFYLLRTRRFYFAFITVALAGFTRLNGLALLPAILLEIYTAEINRSKKIGYLIFGTLISLSGFFVYLLINYYFWGNFFQFSYFEKQNWYTTFDPFGSGLMSALSSIKYRKGLEGFMLSYGQITAFLFGLFFSVYTFWKVRKSYGIFMLGVVGFSYSMSFWLSMPRYILSLFPIFIVLAIFSQNFLFKWLWLLFSIILLTLFGAVFIQYGPIY